MEDAYAALLLRARANGELAPGTDVKSVARFLVTFTQGLRVMEKAADREYLIEAVDQALSVFRGKSADAADDGGDGATPDERGDG